VTPLWIEAKGWESSIGQVVERQSGALLSTHPVEYDLGGAPGIKAAIGRTWNEWRIELAGWYFRPADALKGTIQSQQEAIFWQQPPSNRVAGMSYSASESLRAYGVDFVGFRSSAKGPDRSLELGMGLKLSGLATQQNQAVTDGFNRRQFPDFFDTIATLDQSSNSEMQFLGVGPVVMLHADGHKGPARLRASLGQAVLVGQSRANGKFTAVDQKSYAANPFFPSVILPTPQTTISAIPYSSRQVNVVAVTELELVASLELARGVSLGLSGFLSVWWNAPVAPTFQVANSADVLGLDCQRIRACQPLAGAWSKHRDTLVFPGIGLELRMNF
jgi:hypothetical protein